MVFDYGGFGSLAGSVGSIIGGFSSNRQARKEGNKAREHDIWMARHGYQLQTEDLKNAGLNRVLALGGPPPSAKAVGMANQQNPMADASDAMTKAVGINTAKAEQNLIDEKAKTEGELQKTQRTQQSLNQMQEYLAHMQAAKANSETMSIDLHNYGAGKVDNEIYNSKMGKEFRMMEKGGIAGAAFSNTARSLGSGAMRFGGKIINKFKGFKK